MHQIANRYLRFFFFQEELSGLAASQWDPEFFSESPRVKKNEVFWRAKLNKTSASQSNLVISLHPDGFRPGTTRQPFSPERVKLLKKTYSTVVCRDKYYGGRKKRDHLVKKKIAEKNLILTHWSSRLASFVLFDGCLISHHSNQLHDGWNNSTPPIDLTATKENGACTGKADSYDELPFRFVVLAAVPETVEGIIWRGRAA